MRGGRTLRTLLPCLLLLAGCGGEELPSHRGPVVVVTFAGLRADVVGALAGEQGLTPHLDRLVARADWAGRAIAPSGWSVPAMASLATGLQPWQHQVLEPGGHELAPDLLTLSEALREVGYRTTGYYGSRPLAGKFGFGQGFDAYRGLGHGARAEDHLRGLGAGPELVWVSIPEPQPPYVRRQALLPRLGGMPAALPKRLERREIERWADPAVALPDGARREIAAMYRLSAAWADERLGRLLAALQASGRWDSTLLVVTSSHGEELGEEGRIGSGAGLGRAALEVPLVVKLPAGCEQRIAVPAGGRPGTVRLWATIAELAGAAVPPAVAPSLFRAGAPAVLSELYLGNGTNQFSLVDGDDQLLWTARFAAPEPGYFRARWQVAGGHPEPPLAEPPGAVFDRLQRAFAAAPPLTGRPDLGPPELELVRWQGEGSTPVQDPRRTAELAAELERAFRRFLPEELPPREEWRAEVPPERQAAQRAAAGRAR